MKKFAFLFFVLLSCVNTEPDINNIELKSVNEKVELPYMRVPFRIGLNGESVVLLDLVADSCFMHIVNYPDLKYKESLGIKGGGPNEITLSTPFQFLQDKLFFLDGAKGALFKYDLHNGIIEQTSFDIPVSIDFVPINDTTIIIGDMSGKNRFIRVSPKTKEGLFFIPQDLCEDENNKMYVWRSYMSFNSDLNKIVTATQFGEVIEVYDLKTNKSERFVGNDGAPVQTSNLYGYQDVKWVRNQIYALYAEKTDEILNKTVSKVKGGNIIQLFDQSCNPVLTYHLDQFIYSFTVDTAKNILIGLSANSDDPIFKFDLE